MRHIWKIITIIISTSSLGRDWEFSCRHQQQTKAIRKSNFKLKTHRNSAISREREHTLAEQNPKTVKAKTQKCKKKQTEHDRLEVYLKSMSRQLPPMLPHHNSTVETPPLPKSEQTHFHTPVGRPASRRERNRNPERERVRLRSSWKRVLEWEDQSGSGEVVKKRTADGREGRRGERWQRISE